MTEQAEIRDMELGQLIERMIPVPAPTPNLLTHPVMAGITGSESEAHPRFRRSRRTPWIVAAALVALAAAGAAALNGLTGESTTASRTSATGATQSKISAAIADGLACCLPGETPAEWQQQFFARAREKMREQQHLGTVGKIPSVPIGTTQARTLIAYTYRVNAQQATTLPPSVAEVVSQLGADPSTAQEPITGPPSVYLFDKGPALCMVVAIVGATGSCYSDLPAAGGSLVLPGRSIVDGKLFVTGLAANDVSSITVSAASTARTPGTTVRATLVNNVFFASLPYNGGAIGTVIVTIERMDGTTTDTVELNGIPAPTGR